MNPELLIRPELVAAKLAAADNLSAPELEAQLRADPRRVELMWFLQWASFQPGGLVKFTEDLIVACPDKIGTAAMLAAGPAQAGRYTLAQCLTVWRKEWKNEDHHRSFETLFQAAPVDDFDVAPVNADLIRYDRATTKTGTDSESFNDFLTLYFDPKLTPEQVQRGVGCDQARILDGVERFNFDFFQAEISERTRQRLPVYLRDLCSRTDLGFERKPSWFPALIPALLDFMEQHAARERQRIATTSVVNQVFDALDYAWAEKKLVRVNGDSRFGKTESLTAYCAMYPGRFRLVTAPHSNPVGDLVRTVAEAFGIPVEFGPCSLASRDKVEFILRHGRLGIVVDEAHFLLPIRFGRDSSPERLNWLRAEVVDRRLPCVLSTTPQAYDGQCDRFIKKTKYNMAQFTGRISRNVELPKKLDASELLAVARIHFPEVAEPLLQDAVDAAILSTSYAKALQDIASLARWNAARRSRGASVSQLDLDAAIREVTPEAAAELLGDPAPAQCICKPAASSLRRAQKPAAVTLQSLRPGARGEDLSPEESAPSRRSVSPLELVTV